MKVADLQLKAELLAGKFGWSGEVFSSKLNNAHLFALTMSWINKNLQTLEMLGFSAKDARDMGSRRPLLLTANWTTELHRDKWHFIANVMHLQHSAIVGTPTILEASLRRKLVPRWRFLCQLADAGKLTRSDPASYVSPIADATDKAFAELFDSPGLNLYYNEAYMQASWNKYIS